MQSGNDPIQTLIVDDDPFMLALLEKNLTRRGFTVLKAKSGREAFEVLRQIGPPLLITDLVMPDMDGLELCRLVRSSPEIAFTYVIMQSGMTDKASIMSGFEAGVDAYLTKPIDEAALIARLKAAERIIRLDAFHREHSLRLHKVNAEVATMNGRLQRQTTELEAARAGAESESKTKTTFLADMIHELRSPMTAILGFAELLQTEGDLSKAPPHRVEAIDAILRNSRHLIDLMNNVLDLSKIDEATSTIEPLRCDPLHIAEDACRLMASRVTSPNLRLSADGPKELPYVMADPLRLRQVLINLVGNAIKFTKSGEVRITVSLRVAEAAQSATLQFEVRDTGIGMTPVQIDKLFKRYSQADQTIESRFGGTGLGLMISRRLVSLMHGTIDVASEPGKGSCFTVTLPVDLATDVTPCAAPASSRSAPETTSIRGKSILLVEDSEDVRRLLGLQLAKAGGRLQTATDGVQGLKLASAALDAGHEFDVILMDYHMPEMNGDVAVRTLRQRGYRGVILGLTAGAWGEESKSLLDAGCTACLTKPIAIATLIESIQGHCSKGGTMNRQSNDPEGPLVSEMSGDPDMIELIEGYVNELPDKLQALQKAADEHDIATLARLAHQLKGSGGGYGFPWITDAAKQLEQSSKAAADMATLKAQLASLAELCNRSTATAKK